MRKFSVFVFMVGLCLLLFASWNYFTSAGVGPEKAVANLGPPGEGRYGRGAADVFTEMFENWAAHDDEEKWTWSERDEAIYRLATLKDNQAVLKARYLEQLSEKIKEVQLQKAKLADIIEKETAVEDEGVTYLDEPAEGAVGEAEVLAPGEPGESGEEDSLPEEIPDAELDADDESFNLFLQKDTELAALKEEYDKIARMLAKYDLDQEKDRVCDVAVLNNGAVLAVQKLLASCGRPARLVSPDVSFAGMAKETKLLLIPSGGLSNITQRWRLQNELSGFVKKGGVVLCLAQRRRSDYAMLPGRPAAYGWLECQSEPVDKAVSAVEFHPVTAGLSETTFNAAVDGFISKYPRNAQILLRSNTSGQPVAAVYPVGKGKVLVTTLFTDWLSSHGRISNEEFKFFRAAVNWGISGVEQINEPGKKIKVTCTIQNKVKKMSKSVKFYMISPGNKFAYDFTVKRNVLPGEKDQMEIQMTMPSAGVWQLVYTLLDEQGNEIQGIRHVQYIASGSLKQASLPPSPGYALTSASEYVKKGKRTEIVLHLWNANKTEINLQVTDPNRQKNTVRLAPNEYKRISLSFAGERTAFNQIYFNYRIADSAGQVLAQPFRTCFGIGK